MCFKILPLLILLLTACGPSDPQGRHESLTPELTEAQTQAFIALDLIQMSTDVQNSLYSTFPNHRHQCYPHDTSLSFMQTEFLDVLTYYLENKSSSMPADQRDSHAKAAAEAQATYEVRHCRSETARDHFAELGTWIIPNIAEHRDLVMKW